MRRTPGDSGRKSPRVFPVVWLVLLAVAAAQVKPGHTAYASTPVVAGGRAVIVNTGGDPIRVRQGAGTQFDKVSTVNEGQLVSVLAGPSSDSKGDKWFKVQAPSGTGWIAAAFLDGTSAPAAAPARKLTGSARVAYTDGDPLRVRESPATGPAGKIVTLVDPGTTVAVEAGPVTDTAGVVWYQITAKGLTGWAMAQYLAPVETAKAPPASPVAEKAVARTVPARATAHPASTSTPRATPTAKPAAKPATAPAAQPKVVATRAATGSVPDLAQYRRWMEEARTVFPYPQSVDKMWSVMMCESGGNPLASGGGGAWQGLFQYVPGTWAGYWNPYRNNSIWDARSQIFATARAWSIGMQGAWSCY